MFTARKKTSVRSKPSHLIDVDMHFYYEWIELFSFCIFSLRRENITPIIFCKTRNKVIGNFLCLPLKKTLKNLCL